MRFEVVVAHNRHRGIGLDNKIPWKCKQDMNFFRDLTSTGHNAVVMGSNTFKSLNSKPLSGRVNVVISSSIEPREDVRVFRTVRGCISGLLQNEGSLDRVFIIGGESIYRQFMDARVVCAVHANEILSDETECDTFFAKLPPYFDQVSDYTCSSGRVRYTRYTRDMNEGETQYLRLVQRIVQNGEARSDRTGTGTRSIFGNTQRFSLVDGKVPLLTTKKVFWRGVVEELLWMISGSTDAKKLSAKGVKIWDGNSSREFLDSIGFTERSVGDIGPAYGFQWRHFGAQYVDCSTDYSGQGVDQLANCVHMIKNDPTSRRIILSAWNPSDLGQMSLPPCHAMAQFFVSGQELSCMMFQRSVDVGLGLPFNIASYGLLTHMIANVCGLRARELVHCTGDTHVYSDHVAPLQKQLVRSPLEFPRVQLNADVREIDGFTAADITLCDYYSYPAIEMAFSA